MKKHPLPEKTRENIRTALRRDTREGFLHELAGKGIVPVLWENGAGVIYGVTYIDHNTKAVFKGSALGKEFSASVINRKYGTLPSVPDRPAPGQEPPVNTDTRETGLAERAERSADQLTKYSHITTNHIPYGTRRFQRTRQDHRLHAGG